jgi:hypothetical protein
MSQRETLMADEAAGSEAEMEPNDKAWRSGGDRADLLGHLWRGGEEGPRNPIRVRQARRG